MLAPRFRGAFVLGTLGLLISACSNGTEPTKQSLCDASNPVTLAVGEVRTPLSDACVYVSNGAASGEYALVPFNADTAYQHTSSLSFTSSGVTGVSTPLQTRVIANAPLFDVSPTASAATSVQPSNAFELQLRASERRVLRPLIPGARAWYQNRTAPNNAGILRPSFSTASAPPAVGDLVTVNARTGTTLSDVCQVPDNRTGRVVAVTDHAIVLADTANPTGGYTDAEYQSIGVAFDTVYTMDTGAFGTPTDIDSNGRIVMFFTRAVNEMTPKGSSTIVGGFFYARDLFPKQDSPELGAGSGCPTSNFAELFYLAVPDPNALVNGNTNFTKAFISRLAVSTTAHEFQHLINAARRLYVNTSATDFEVVWLNEGLSHIAEELLFLTESGLAPRADIDSLKIRSSSNTLAAFNNDEGANFLRYAKYLPRTATSSPYAPDDSLWTRAATYTFLRFAADHRGTSDSDTWFKLVNSTTTGIDNLKNVFGTGLPAIFRDWAVSQIADNVQNVNSEWQEPSWNWRSVFIASTLKSYPLSTVTVSDNTPLTVTLNGGGAAYVRFVVPAGQVGSVKWTTQSTAIAMSLVRLK
jgi:hypothetical protein